MIKPNSKLRDGRITQEIFILVRPTTCLLPVPNSLLRFYKPRVFFVQASQASYKQVVFSQASPSFTIE